MNRDPHAVLVDHQLAAGQGEAGEGEKRRDVASGLGWKLMVASVLFVACFFAICVGSAALLMPLLPMPLNVLAWLAVSVVGLVALPVLFRLLGVSVRRVGQMRYKLIDTRSTENGHAGDK